jgi:hypothetical protein
MRGHLTRCTGSSLLSCALACTLLTSGCAGLVPRSVEDAERELTGRGEVVARWTEYSEKYGRELPFVLLKPARPDPFGLRLVLHSVAVFERGNWRPTDSLGGVDAEGCLLFANGPPQRYALHKGPTGRVALRGYDRDSVPVRTTCGEYEQVPAAHAAVQALLARK